jgi:hypothetical protein
MVHLRSFFCIPIIPFSTTFLSFSVNRNGLILSTNRSSKSYIFTDSCVVYEYEKTEKYGIIQNIFYIAEQHLYVLKIHPLQNTRYDSLTINNRTFSNKHIIYGDMSHNTCGFIHATSVIEKGCFYENKDTCYFARFPNLYESS